MPPTWLEDTKRCRPTVRIGSMVREESLSFGLLYRLGNGAMMPFGPSFASLLYVLFFFLLLLKFLTTKGKPLQKPLPPSIAVERYMMTYIIDYA